MAAGDLNDPLSNIPNIVLVDQSAASAAPGAGYARLEVVNGALGVRVGTGAWVPLVSLVAGLLTPLDEKVTPADTDLVLLQDEADASALKKVQVSNLPGGGNGGGYTEGCRVYGATQTLANGWSAIAFNAERYDTDTMHDNVTNNTRITATTPGKYLITGSATFAPSAAGSRGLGVVLNGASYISILFVANQGAGAETPVAIATLWALGAGDYVELHAFQGSGGTLDIDAQASYSPEFAAARVG